MLESLIYKNHLGEVLEFGKNGLYVSQNDLHNYSWDIQSKNNKIASFRKEISSFNVPVVIVADSAENATRLKNKLFEICEKDVLTNQYGKLIMGDYYLRCFISESKKDFYLRDKTTFKTTLTVVTDYPFWIKESMFTYNYGQGTVGSNLDYENDFPYDYTSNLAGSDLFNSGITPANFLMRIYGVVENPKVTISGHDYEVSVSIAESERLEIDSEAKTINKIQIDGTIVNCFNLRNKDSYIFEKVGVGSNPVSTNASFLFDIIAYEERSEPKWI